MSVNVTEFQRWSDVLDHKARILYAQIAQAQRDVAEHGGDDQMLDALCEPYIELLKSMYAEDYPLARAIEESDLLVSLEGPAISRENPRVSIITNIFTRVRSEVANVAKAIAQISESQKRLPKEMDLGLSAFAKGSLILGFTLPSPSEIEESKDGQRSLLGEEDPLYRAAREAIRTIGLVKKHVAEGNLDRLAEAVPDAKVRDTALSAIQNLTPTGRQGINSVNIAGRQVGTDLGSKALTPVLRDTIRQRLEHPISVVGEEVNFIGDVREIDLDARRFELRHIENMEANDVRCSYVEQTDEEASQWLNNHVRVHGIVERDAGGKARLLEVASIEILT